MQTCRFWDHKLKHCTLTIIVDLVFHFLIYPSVNSGNMLWPSRIRIQSRYGLSSVIKFVYIGFCIFFDNFLDSFFGDFCKNTFHSSFRNLLRFCHSLSCTIVLCCTIGIAAANFEFPFCATSRKRSMRFPALLLV